MNLTIIGLMSMFSGPAPAWKYARIQVAPAQYVDRKVVLDRRAGDAVEARVICRESLFLAALCRLGSLGLLRILLAVRCRRELQREHGAAGGAILDGNVSSVRFHDLLHD